MAVDKGREDSAVREVRYSLRIWCVSLSERGYIRKRAIFHSQEHVVLNRSATAVNQPAGLDEMGPAHSSSRGLISGQGI